MAIPFADADSHLKGVLAEERDSADEAAFPQSVRRQALQEAVVAIARLRPDQFAESIELDYDSDGDAYVLPDANDYLLEVIGLKDSDGNVQTLFPSSYAELTKNSPCWRTDQSKEVQPQNFAWSPAAPRLVYVNGYKPNSKLMVIASNLSAATVSGTGDTLALPYSFFPEMIDYALSRLYSREDTGAGDASYHLSRFTQLMNNRAETDQMRNPLTMAMLSTEARS